MKLLSVFMFVFCGLFIAGCATSEQLAKNLEQKDLAGKGFFSKQKIGLDETNQTPTMESLIVSGSFKTIKADSNFVDYSKEESGAWYNAENKTTITTLTATCEKGADLAEILKAAVELEKAKQETYKLKQQQEQANEGSTKN